MRVLIYAEPFPIRDSVKHFDDVVCKFLPVLTASSKIDIRVFANNTTFDSVGEKSLAPCVSRLIRSTPEEEITFQSFIQPWREGGSEIWLNLMAGIGAISESTLQVLRRIWATFPFEAIIHWGENGAITRFIEDYPVTRIAMELGCTRPPFFDSIVMDPFGTNGAGVIPKLDMVALRDIVDNRPMSRHEALFGFSQDLAAKGYTDQFRPLPADLSMSLPSERLVFLPLQLFDDANLLRFSPYDSISDVVLNVVPKLAEKGYTTLIKPHPASIHRKGADLANNIARANLRPWDDHVIWSNQISDVPNARLFALADFTVTVNSSVGFEALYFDKPVVVLGNAVYKPKGLFPALETMLTGTFNEAAYLDGIGILRRFMLGGYLQPEQTRRDGTVFANRIGLIDHLSRSHPNDPIAFAKGFWQSVAPSQQAFATSAMFRGLSVPGQAEFGVPPVPKLAQQVNDTCKKSAVLAQVVQAYRPIVRKLLSHAAAETEPAFVEWLESLWATPEGRVQVIELGEFVDPLYYLTTYNDVKEAGWDPVAHFGGYGLAELRAPRKTIKGVSPEQTFACLQLAAKSVLSQEGLPDFPLPEDEANSRSIQLDALRASIAQSSNRIAVVAHLYYRDLVPQILAQLGMIDEPFDLIVTLPDWGARPIIELVQAAYPAAMLYRAANRGRDIGPFMDVLPTLIGKYEAVLKIQTKQGYYRGGRLIAQFGKIWRDEALSALLGSKERVAAILAALRADPELKMIGPEPYLLSLADYPYHDGGELAEQRLGGLRIEDRAFFAGTMFWLRPECLHVLAEIPLTYFAPEGGANDGALAHLIERMFGEAATLNGGTIAGAPISPDDPLSLDPEPTEVTMDAYLTERQEAALRSNAAEPSRGALIW